MFVVSTKKEFIEDALAAKDGIVCFGAGRMVNELEHLLGDQLKKIIYFVDKDELKQRDGVVLLGKKIKVLSYEEAEKRLENKNVVILITRMDFVEILELLTNNKIFSKAKIHCLYFIRGFIQEEEDLKQSIPENIKIYDKQVIPKIIHYCWFGNKEISQQNIEWIDTWKKYCPDYKIVRWDESNYDVNKNRYVKEAYEANKWAFISDYARMDILYNYGGIYLDVDVELISNIDDMLYEDAFICFETPKKVASGLGIGARKNSRIIKRFMDYYEGRSFFMEDGKMDLTPCPIHETKILKEIGLVNNGSYQVLDGITVYPEKMLTGKSASTRRIKFTNYTRAIHHYDASWESDKKRKNINIIDELIKRQLVGMK